MVFWSPLCSMSSPTFNQPPSPPTNPFPPFPPPYVPPPDPGPPCNQTSGQCSDSGGWVFALVPILGGELNLQLFPPDPFCAYACRPPTPLLPVIFFFPAVYLVIFAVLFLYSILRSTWYWLLQHIEMTRKSMFRSVISFRKLTVCGPPYHDKRFRVA